MTDLVDALRRLLGDLEAVGGGYAIVGALAVSIRTEPRFTRDIDIAVAASSDAAAEDHVRAMIARGYRAVATVEHEERGRLATVRYASLIGEEFPIVDILYASTGVEPEIIATTEAVEVLPGVIAAVASVSALIAMKLLSVRPERPNDAADLLALRSIATRADWAHARQLVTLMLDRGFARGRDLTAALDALRTSGAL